MRFDQHTVVLLARPSDPPELPQDAIDRLQDTHLAHQAGLVQQGLVLAAGPVPAPRRRAAAGLRRAVDRPGRGTRAATPTTRPSGPVAWSRGSRASAATGGHPARSRACRCRSRCWRRPPGTEPPGPTSAGRARCPALRRQLIERDHPQGVHRADDHPQFREVGPAAPAGTCRTGATTSRPRSATVTIVSSAVDALRGGRADHDQFGAGPAGGVLDVHAR